MYKRIRSNINTTVHKNIKHGIYKKFFKRPIDLILVLLSIIILSPILLILAIWVRIKLGSPVIFKQRRPGLNEKIFMLCKFRTMTDEKDKNGELLPDSMRLTKFGKFLRSTSLDELPELFNILKGDMSIVGPRPLLVQYLPLYNEKQKHRHDVRPGLSGLAQISGRNNISWEEKFNLDIKYVDNITFIQDLKIIFLTIKKVFAREGINSNISATMEPFRGNIQGKTKDKDKLLIIGASGQGRVIADIALKMKKWNQIVFLDDDNVKYSMDFKVVGKVRDVDRYISEYDIFVAIGNNSTRKKIQNQLEKKGASIPILIHPKAIIGEKVEFKIGTVVMAGAVISCCTKVGKGCIINTSATVDHDNVIGDYVHISPGVNLAGTVHVGKGTWLGIGSVVINNISIASWCKIGAGGVVVKNLKETGTYVGVPVRRV